MIIIIIIIIAIGMSGLYYYSVKPEYVVLSVNCNTNCTLFSCFERKSRPQHLLFSLFYLYIHTFIYYTNPRKRSPSTYLLKLIFRMNDLCVCVCVCFT